MSWEDILKNNGATNAMINEIFVNDAEMPEYILHLAITQPENKNTEQAIRWLVKNMQHIVSENWTLMMAFTDEQGWGDYSEPYGLHEVDWEIVANEFKNYLDEYYMAGGA